MSKSWNHNGTNNDGDNQMICKYAIYATCSTNTYVMCKELSQK